jgi:CheY-like chemotaxis protein
MIIRRKKSTIIPERQKINKQYNLYSYSRPISPSPSFSLDENIDSSFDNNRLTSIDVISLDKQSRVTLTKNIKKIIPLEPSDKIAVYQDRYNKNIILKVQKQEEKNRIDNWVLIIKKVNEHGFSNKKKRDLLPSKTSFIDKAKDVVGESKSHVSPSPPSSYVDRYTSLYKQDTLYSTPILLVDDEPDLLFNFDMILKDEGYKDIKSFSNSKNLLKYLLEMKSDHRFHYKLIILDIRMPEINGIQLYQILKILNPPIKAIFMTALDAVDELTSMYQDIKQGDIIRKPIGREKFIQIVNDKVSTLLGGSIILSVLSLLTRIIQDSLFV